MKLDHLAWASNDLDKGIAEFRRLSGVEAAYGGSHPGHGTRNALAGLGNRLYLAIDGPDPAQEQKDNNGEWMAAMDGFRLTAFATAVEDIEQAASDFVSCGLETDIERFARRRPDGALIEWDALVVSNNPFSVALPLVVQWRTEHHPAKTAPNGCSLIAFEARHPDKENLAEFYKAVGLDMSVNHGREPALTATIRGTKGDFTL
jgi:hypothetical protein